MERGVQNFAVAIEVVASPLDKGLWVETCEGGFNVGRQVRQGGGQVVEEVGKAGDSGGGVAGSVGAELVEERETLSVDAGDEALNVGAGVG